MIVLLKQDEEAMGKDIVSYHKKSIQFFVIIYLVWRIHELAEQEFEQGRFRRRRYRQQMRELHLQTSSIHHSPYGHQSVPSFYPPSTNSYYMCSPSSPSYHTIYSTSTETHPITSPILPNVGLTSSTPTSYPLYDSYSTSYYPTYYHSMTSSYTSPNESINFDG
jgi:hypothetical protein